jgi:protein involved in polysaccharide export with SLBB domain
MCSRSPSGRRRQRSSSAHLPSTRALASPPRGDCLPRADGQQRGDAQHPLCRIAAGRRQDAATGGERGRSPSRGKANQPQVLVRVIRNATSNVTVVGEVAASTRMPLTARGERLLDALAAAGGVRQPVGKVTLQLTRGEQVHALALDTIIRDPKQNIALQPGDVVTALFQPLSFIVLGATAKNEELNFEAQGITLAQALARVGGVQDRLADARAVFIFRFEDPRCLTCLSHRGRRRRARCPSFMKSISRIRKPSSSPRGSRYSTGMSSTWPTPRRRVAEVPRNHHAGRVLGTQYLQRDEVTGSSASGSRCRHPAAGCQHVTAAASGA